MLLPSQVRNVLQGCARSAYVSAVAHDLFQGCLAFRTLGPRNAQIFGLSGNVFALITLNGISEKFFSCCAPALSFLPFKGSANMPLLPTLDNILTFHSRGGSGVACETCYAWAQRPKEAERLTSKHVVGFSQTLDQMGGWSRGSSSRRRQTGR